MNRRGFLRAIGAAAAVSAGGIELLQLAVPGRTFFLPPVGGWSPAERAGQQFEAFIKQMLREMAASFGIPYKDLTAEYDGPRYSASRVALIHSLRAAPTPRIHAPNQTLAGIDPRRLSENLPFTRNRSLTDG